MIKLSFSGHETFSCRSLWLKKGYDFIKEGNSFNDEKAIGELGVGKNMVTSIRFWLKAFGIIDNNDKINHEGPHTILFEEELDPYLEDHTSIWLLHYYLVKTNKASIYNLVFNNFRKERIEFTRDQLHWFLKRTCEETNTQYNENTIKNDINVFIKNYVRPYQSNKNIEDDFSSLLIELNLVKTIRNPDETIIPRYATDNSERDDIPWQLLLFAILDFSDKKIISFNDLLTKPNSIGLVFALSANGLLKKVNLIVKELNKVHFTDDNGIRELQFTGKFDKWEILKRCYE